MNETHQNLSNKRESFIFWKFLSLFKKMLEISLVTELSDNVAVISCAEYVVTFKDVVVIEFFQCIDFSFEHTFFGFSLDRSDVNDFDGDFLFRLIVRAFVDNWAVTSSYNILQTIGIVLYFFSEVVVTIERMVLHLNSI